MVTGKGSQQALLSLSERKSRLTPIAGAPGKHAGGVGKAVPRLLKPLAGRVHTPTPDNGKEFARHPPIAEAPGAGFYFSL